MTILLFPFFSLIVLFFLPQSSKAYTFGQFLIKDFETTDLTTEATSWSIYTPVCSSSSCPRTFTIPGNTCGLAQDIVYGGPNVLGPSESSTSGYYYEREYASMYVGIKYFAVEFDVWIFSSVTSATPDLTCWMLNDPPVDENIVRIGSECNVPTSMNGATVNFISQYHYYGWYSLPTTVLYGRATVIRIKSTSSKSSLLYSFGVRNLKIYKTESQFTIDPASFPCPSGTSWSGDGCFNCHSLCQSCYGTTNNQCGTCKTSNYNYNNGTCLLTCTAPFAQRSSSGSKYCEPTCPTSFYWAHNNSCTDTCPSPFTESTDVNNLKICSSPCIDLGQFIYPNKSCIADCLTPLLPKIEPSGSKSVKLCINPCLNLDDTPYLYPDGSCQQNCDFPLVIRINPEIKYCQSPCVLSTQSLYKNSTCFPQCSPPLEVANELGVTYCRNPCDRTPTTNYLFPNSSCYSSCPKPLLTWSMSGTDFCYNPCNSLTEYLYRNSSCSSKCDLPMVIVNEPKVQYCRNPCSIENNEFLFPNGSCITSCPPPLLERSVPGTLFCYNPCNPDTEFLYKNSSCSSKCDSPMLTISEPSVRYCKNPCDGTNDFLFPNKSCIAECPPPLLERSVPDTKFCYNPCNLDAEYLYQNSSCISKCDLPMLTVNEPSVQYCRNPCNGTDNFLYPNSSCIAECPKPLLIRSVPDTIYCYNPCDPDKEYLYKNSSCSSKCDSPLVIQIHPTVQYCRNPCDTEANNLFVYPNRTCMLSCPQPLSMRIVPDINYCYNPCDQKTQFLFENGTCISTCEPPLIIQEAPGVRYCRNPCYSTQEFLYPNSSCKSSCSFPLFNHSEPGINYCYNPCSHNKTFLQYNQSCQETCFTPLKIKSEPVANFCQLPCKNLDHYYFEITGECQPTCGFPYIAVDSSLPKLCLSSLSAEEKEKIADIADAADAADAVTDTGALVYNVISSGDSTAACIGSITKMLQYVKFMKIKFPEKVQLMLEQQNANANEGGFTSKMVADALNDFPRNRLPGKFQSYQTHSSFFVNFWPTFFNLSMILLVILIAAFIKYKTKPSSKIHGISQNVTEALKWNVTLTTFCGSLGDVMLFTALEFQSIHLDNFPAVLSLIVCLAVNTITFCVLFKILDVNNILRKSKQDTKKKVEQQLSSYKALFEYYKDSSYYQSIFLFIFIIRLLLFNSFIGYVYDYPLFQAIIFTLMNILMLLYLVIKKPMKKIVNLLQQIILELVLVPFNLCVLILAIMDKQGVEAIKQRENIGNVIIFINVAVPFITIALVVAKVVAIGIEFYQQRKAEKLNAGNKLKEFNVEAPRKQSDILDISKEVSHVQTDFSVSMHSKTPLENDNTQMLDISENIDSPELREEQNVIMNNSLLRPSRKRRIRMQISESEIQLHERSNTSLAGDLGFQDLGTENNAGELMMNRKGVKIRLKRKVGE